MRSVSASLIDGAFTEAEIIDPLSDQRRRPPIPAALLDDSPAPRPTAAEIARQRLQELIHG